MMKRLLRRLAALLRRDAREAELDDEIRFHIDMEARELMASGLDAREARRRARVAFGGVERHKERARETMGVRSLESFLEDVRFGVRSLARSPGFTVSALTTLALGIGAATAIFSVVDAVLLEPLPFPESERLVRLYQAAPERGYVRGAHSLPNFRDWRERSEAVTEMGLYSTFPSGVVLTGQGPATELRTAYVAGGFFRTLGVDALVGRTLDPARETGENRLVVLSHGFWQRRFGGEPGVVGRVVTLDHQPFEVVGVMPESFAFPSRDVEAWVFLTTIDQRLIPTELRFVRFPQAVGRLAPGVTPERAQEELTGIARALAEEYPDANAGLTAATVDPLREVMVGDVRSALWVVMGAVGFILLMACVNVANLLLARSADRRSEVAVRMSLGAGRRRIVRQLLTESVVLAAVAGGLGVLLASLGSRALLARSAGLLPRIHEVDMDGGVLLFAVGVTVATATLFGVLPALRSTETAPAEALRAGARGAGSSRSLGGLRRLLVAGQVTVGAVLLVGSGLLIRSMGELSRVDPGFEPEGLAAMTLTISNEKYPTRPQYLAFYRRILEQVEGIPGVESVASIRRLPLGGAGEQTTIRVPGFYEPPPEEQSFVELIQVSEGLFETMGMELLAGRGPGPLDGPDDPPVVVVNEALVRQYFQGQDPLGRQIRLGSGAATVVGVVEDVHHFALDQEPVSVAYVPQEQEPRIGMTFVARAGEDPGALLGPMRAVVQSLDPDQPVSRLGLVEESVYASVAQPRFFTVLMVTFGAIAVALCAVGIYGVIAYTVRQRAREIGLRMALGAHARDVVGLVVRQGMIPALIGLASGLAAARAISTLMDSLLFEVSAADPATYAAAAMLLALVGLAACVLPARWAARVDPMIALRNE